MYICINKSTMKNILILLSVLFSAYVVLFKGDDSVIKSNKDVKIEIVGLNSYDESDLSLIKSSIEKFYGFECVISNPVVNEFDYCEIAQSNLGKNDYFVYDNNEKIVIYSTNQELKSSSLGKSVQGICYGNQIYLKSNIVYDKSSSKLLVKVNSIHEVAHSLGLQHCENQCIMNSESLKYWDEASDKPIFCDGCKSKLP